MKNSGKTYFLIFNLISSFIVSGFANSADNLTRVLLCTSQGYQWISVETDPDLLDNDISVNNHCMSCVVTGNDTETYICPSNSFDLGTIQQKSVFRIDNIVHHDHLLTNLEARAPPFFI